MRRLCLMILSLCMLVLSGCATINSDIHINRDGSGTWDATVKSQAEPIEKKVITNRILPISRGREEVEYLKFKRFAPGTEQRIRIEKSSRW